MTNKLNNKAKIRRLKNEQNTKKQKIITDIKTILSNAYSKGFRMHSASSGAYPKLRLFKVVALKIK